jgi:hypothetical protein
MVFPQKVSRKRGPLRGVPKPGSHTGGPQGGSPNGDPQMGVPQWGSPKGVPKWWSPKGGPPREVPQGWSRKGGPPRVVPQGGPQMWSPRGSLKRGPPRGFPLFPPRRRPVPSPKGFPTRSVPHVWFPQRGPTMEFLNIWPLRGIPIGLSTKGGPTMEFQYGVPEWVSAKCFPQICSAVFSQWCCSRGYHRGNSSDGIPPRGSQNRIAALGFHLVGSTDGVPERVPPMCFCRRNCHNWFLREIVTRYFPQLFPTSLIPKGGHKFRDPRRSRSCGPTSVVPQVWSMICCPPRDIPEAWYEIWAPQCVSLEGLPLWYMPPGVSTKVVLQW